MSESLPRILIADDDAGIRQALQSALQRSGFAVRLARDGLEAVARATAEPFHAVVLDINMPGMSGVEACRRIRQAAPLISILVLTVRDGQEDLIRALDAGADDYITKPFDFRELNARLRAAVRRTRHLSAPNEVIVIGEIELDSARRFVRRAGIPVRLTPKEFDVLHTLMSKPGVPIPHARLLQTVWGPEYGNELEYLRTFIRQLRIKLEDVPSQPSYLLTEPYVGYRFREP